MRGLSRDALAQLFLRERIRVLGLAPVRTSLQDAYAGLTADLEQHRSSDAAPSDYLHASRTTNPAGARSAEGAWR